MLAQGSLSPMPVAAALPLESKDRLYSLAAALDEISEGAVLMNEEGQLIWHNRAFDKLLVENREGHLLVAAVIESAADFYLDSNNSPGQNGEHSTVRDMTVGRIEHEINCTLIPEGMLSEKSYVLCLIKRSASR